MIFILFSLIYLGSSFFVYKIGYHEGYYDGYLTATDDAREDYQYYYDIIGI